MEARPASTPDQNFLVVELFQVAVDCLQLGLVVPDGVLVTVPEPLVPVEEVEPFGPAVVPLPLAPAGVVEPGEPFSTVPVGEPDELERDPPDDLPPAREECFP